MRDELRETTTDERLREGDHAMSDAFEIARLDVYALEAKIDTPVATSFGSIPARVSALVRIEDADGHAGWSEIWGNFPSITCAYRATLACKVLPEPLLSWMQRLKRVFHIDIEHCGVCGATLRVIACIDTPEVIERILAHLATRATGAINDPCAPPLGVGAAQPRPPSLTIS